MQTLSQDPTEAEILNGNVFIGWGANPLVSEHRADGTALFIAQLGAIQEALASSYRAFKIGLDDWHAFPAGTPALWIAANSSAADSPTSFYVSWNGATEIVTWRIFSAAAANFTSISPTTLLPLSQTGVFLGEATKSGFETAFTAPAFHSAGYAQAIDKQGNVLGISPIKTTYVPSSRIGQVRKRLEIQSHVSIEDHRLSKRRRVAIGIQDTPNNSYRYS